VPVVEILGQIDFLSSPERSLVLLVHLPDLFRVSLLSRCAKTTLRVSDASHTS
jgi:hypothetical protein